MEPAPGVEEERRRRVAARYAEVTSTWGFNWLCVLTDAKRLSRALAVKSGGKHVDFDDLVHDSRLCHADPHNAPCSHCAIPARLVFVSFPCIGVYKPRSGYGCNCSAKC